MKRAWPGGSVDRVCRGVRCGGARPALLLMALMGSSAFADPCFATFSWMAPTQNVDGSPIGAIQNYTIHEGAQPGVYSLSYDIPGTELSYDWASDCFNGQRIFWSITVTTADGTSDYSTELTRRFNWDTDAPPGPPGDISIDNVDIAVDCPDGYTCTVIIQP